MGSVISINDGMIHAAEVADLYFSCNPFLSGIGEMDYMGKDGFLFEEDFVEENIRCIPMIVRFKLDLIGIKLKLAEWSDFETEERKQLSTLPAVTVAEQVSYRNYLRFLVRWRVGSEASELPADPDPVWAKTHMLPETVIVEAVKYQWQIQLRQWKLLTHLQRFALVKLSKRGHENRNFPMAMQEFGLVNKTI